MNVTLHPFQLDGSSERLPRSTLETLSGENNCNKNSAITKYTKQAQRRLEVKFRRYQVVDGAVFRPVVFNSLGEGLVPLVHTDVAVVVRALTDVPRNGRLGEVLSCSSFLLRQKGTVLSILWK